jgi:beta-galactosidase beta subunit
MAIHFPGEGHSPAISPTPFKKAIFKVYMGE